MKKPVNPYEGIFFFPHFNKYRASIGTRVIGYFDSLNVAVGIRRSVLRSKHA